jgi:hypothetical protein
MREACMTRLSHMYKVHLVPGVSQNEVPHGDYFTKQDGHLQVRLYVWGEYIVTCSWKCYSRVSYPECNWKVFLEVGSSYSPSTCFFCYDLVTLERERDQKSEG